MSKVFKYSLASIVLIAASISGTMAFMSLSQAENVNKQSNETKVALTQESIKPIFAEIDPFTVTLYGEHRNRILYTSITLKLNDEPSKEQIIEYMPEVRDRILKTLSTIEQGQIKSMEDREGLANKIKDSLAKPYVSTLSGPNISNVLFTAFVVQ